MSSLTQQALTTLIQHVSFDPENSIERDVLPLLFKTRSLNKFFYRYSESTLKRAITGRFQVVPEQMITSPLNHREGCECTVEHWGPIDSSVDFWRFDDFPTVLEAYTSLKSRIFHPGDTPYMPKASELCQVCLEARKNDPSPPGDYVPAPIIQWSAGNLDGPLFPWEMSEEEEEEGSPTTTKRRRLFE